MRINNHSLGTSSLKVCLRRERDRPGVETRSQPLLTLPGQRRKARSASISSTIPATTNVKCLDRRRESSQQNAKPTEKDRLNGDRSSRTRKLTRERALRRIHVSCCPPMTRSSSRSQNRKARPELRKRVAEGQVKRQQGKVRADVAKKR